MRVIRVSVLVVMAACAVTREPHDAGDDSGVPRIRLAPDANVAFAACGGSVPVVTELPARTPLTAAECRSVCAGIWGNGSPIGSPVGCDLEQTNSVYCSGTVYDCGDCIFSTCMVGCAGCCTGNSCCSGTVVAEYCRRHPCDECPAEDSRCSLDSCRNFKACGGTLRSEPDPSSCADADGGVDANFELATLCPDACNVMQAGAVVEAGCSDAGTTLDAGAQCLADCQTSRDACVAACTRESFGACMNCSAKCGFDDAYCVRHCN